jgi:hypothetical protein
MEWRAIFIGAIIGVVAGYAMSMMMAKGGLKYT